jgi:hypothetical protein
VRVTLAAFLDAVVIVDPVQYQCRPDEREDIPMYYSCRFTVSA